MSPTREKTPCPYAEVERACIRWAAARRIGRCYLRGTRRFFGSIARSNADGSVLLWLCGGRG